MDQPGPLIMYRPVSQGSGFETAQEPQLGVFVPSVLMSPEQDLSSKCAVSEDTKSGIVASDAQAAVGFVQVQNPVYEELNSDSPVSVRSQVQDSAYGSIYDSAEDHLNLEDRSGTEHPELPQVPHPAEHNRRDLIYESEMRPRKGEAVVEIPEDALGAQKGSATRGTGLPQLPDPAGHRQGEAASLLGQSESQPRDGFGEKCQDCQDLSATRNRRKRTLGGCLATAERIRSHPVLTLAVLTLLLLLAVALAVSLAAVSGRSCGDTPVTRVTPVTSDTPVLLACADDWVGYNGICYFLSRDRLTWNQAKAQCTELEASLAVLNDKEIEILFQFSKITDYWIGLHGQDQKLQWVDGSNFNSSVPVQGNADCVHLAENYLGRQPCSSDMQYICSKAQTRL